MTTRLDRRALLAAAAAGGLTAALPAAARQRPFFERIGRPIGVQLYSLGEAARTDLAGTLRALAAIGYRDFELPGLYGRTPQALAADAEAARVRYGAIHLALPPLVPPGELTLIDSAQAIADALGPLGIRRAVLPFPPLPADFRMPAGDPRPALVAGVQAGGLDGWRRLGDLLNARAAALRPFGIGLSYHNHNMEFRPQEGTTGWRVLLDRLDPALVSLELDLGWVAAAGLDPASEIRRLRGRVRMVHLKDLMAAPKPDFAMGQVPADIGKGALDWTAILSACDAVGVEHYYVERERPFPADPLASMADSYRFLGRLTI